jgi:hypothetical protein
MIRVSTGEEDTFTLGGGGTQTIETSFPTGKDIYAKFTAVSVGARLDDNTTGQSILNIPYYSPGEYRVFNPAVNPGTYKIKVVVPD